MPKNTSSFEVGSTRSGHGRRGGLGGRTVVAILALSALGLACDGSGAPGSLRTVERFVEAPIQEPFRPADLVSGEPLFDWKLRGLGVGADWGGEQATYSLDLAGQSAVVSMEGNRLQIERAVDLDAAQVDRVDIVLASRREGASFTGNVSLLWAEAGGTLETARGFEVPAGEPIDGGLRLYQFALRSHPAWSGRIERIWIVCSIAERARIAVRRVTGYRDGVGAEQLMTLHQRGLKASLGEQARDALLALPGMPIERQVALPERAELRFAVGLQEGLDQPVDLRVEAEIVGQEASVLWRGRLTPEPEAEPDALAPGRWHSVRVPLRSVAGQEVTLRLVADSETTLDPRQGFALWGHPEILAPRPSTD